jgi:hypothetical protein
VSPGGGVIGTVISRSSNPQREREEREKRECVWKREWKRKDRIIFFLVCTEWLQEEEHWVREG